jgi:hypothetical protein
MNGVVTGQTTRMSLDHGQETAARLSILISLNPPRGEPDLHHLSTVYVDVYGSVASSTLLRDGRANLPT